MRRVSPKEIDPVRYNRIKEDQKNLENEYSHCLTMARLCPYCNNKVETLYKGSHGAISVKCSSCGEPVFFPPVVFRVAG